MIGNLPECLAIGNTDYGIRSDYRNVLQVFEAFNDADMGQEEKWTVAIYLLYEDFYCDDDVYAAIEEGFDAREAVEQIIWFISGGNPREKKDERPTYDWEQDEQMIFSSINKVAGKEVRELEYLHWWTFLGYFHEIGEGTFSFIIGIRDKKNRNKKLEKYEKDFVRRNRDLVEITPRKTADELEEDARWKEVLGI